MVSSKFTKTVIFFPGFLKSSTDFDITSSNKEINISNHIAKQANVHRVHLTFADYVRPFDEICGEIINDVYHMFPNTKLVLVGHSYGCLFITQCINTCSDLINGVILIDPTIKNESYKCYLQEQLHDSYQNKEQSSDFIQMIQHKLDNFDKFPEICVSTIAGIDVTIILNRNTKELSKQNSKESYFQQIESQLKSQFICQKFRLIIYDNVSHMIHYKRSADVIKLIKNTLNRI